MRWMPLRPGPPLDIPEARRANHDTVLRAYDGERHSSRSIAPRQCRIDISRSFSLPLRNRTPAIQRRIGSRSRHQSVNVPMLQRFQPNVFAFQRERLSSHGFILAPVAPASRAAVVKAPRLRTRTQLRKPRRRYSDCLITVTLLYATRKPKRSALRCEVLPPCVTTTAYSHPAASAAAIRARSSAVCRPRPR